MEGPSGQLGPGQDAAASSESKSCSKQECMLRSRGLDEQLVTKATESHFIVCVLRESALHQKTTGLPSFSGSPSTS